MSSSAPSTLDVLDVVDTLGPPGTPFTTPEIAEHFECTDRTVYNRLDTLVDDGTIETKKVGAKGRVWWRPTECDSSQAEASAVGRAQLRSHPVFDSDLVGVLVWGPDTESDDPSELVIEDANDAFLEMSGFEYEEALGTSWRTLTPEAFYDASEDHIEQVWATGSGLAYDKQYYHADGSRWWGLFESRSLTEETFVEFVVDINDRKEARKQLEKEAELDAFRVDLADAIRPLVDSIEVQHEAARVLGERLDVAGAHYGEVEDDGKTNRVYADYSREPGDSLVGEHHLDDYGVSVAEAFQAGETVVVEDYRELPELSAAERATYEQVGVTAWVGVPLFKQGELTAFVAVTESESREWTDAEVAMVEETVSRTWDAVERTRVQEILSESNQSLERLNDVSRELIDADPETIRERVAEVTVAVLDLEYAALWRYNGRTGDLERHTEHAASGTGLDAIRPSGVSHEDVWDTFVDDEVDVDNAFDIADDDGRPSRLGSRVFVPLGRHGVIVAGSVDSATFDERMLDLVTMVASTVETAWDRAESERELERRNEELTRLDRLNTLIRGVDQALVAADTREEIDATVCDRLADSALYEFAWLGEFDATEDTIRPRSWAGVDSATVEDLATVRDDAGADAGPFLTALREHELQVVEDIATDARTGSWREIALERGARSALAIPLVYDESIYGLLAVYGKTPTRNHRDTDVLAELGTAIAHAINAVETRATFQTDSVVELTLRSRPADAPLCRLSDNTDSTLVFDGVVPRANGTATVFFTAEDATVEELSAGSDDVLGIADLECLGDCRGGTMFRGLVSESDIASHVLDRDGTIRSLRFDAGTVTIVVDLPESVNVREFVDSLGREIPGLELLSRRSRRREPGQTLRSTVLDRLTPRQQQVLQLAYRSGYFESPRVQTGKELAEALDIVPSTFTRHIREAQRTVFEVIFAPGEQRAVSK